MPEINIRNAKVVDQRRGGNHDDVIRERIRRRLRYMRSQEGDRSKHISIPIEVLNILDLPNFALVISDMQEKYLMHYYGDRTKFMNKLLEMIDYCYFHRVPVFFIARRDPDLDMAKDWNMENAWGHPISSLDVIAHELLEKINDSNFQIIEKDTDDAFWQTDLEEKLKSQNVQTILTVGCFIDGCIFATSNSARVNGFCAYATSHASLANSFEGLEFTLDLFASRGIEYVNLADDISPKN